VAILTAVVGCAAIWGYDVVRAREVERDVRDSARPPALEPAARPLEVD
jgi:hypothetical protein